MKGKRVRKTSRLQLKRSAKETSGCGDLPARSKAFRSDGIEGGNEIGGCAE